MGVQKPLMIVQKPLMVVQKQSSKASAQYMENNMLFCLQFTIATVIITDSPPLSDTLSEIIIVLYIKCLCFDGVA